MTFRKSLAVHLESTGPEPCPLAQGLDLWHEVVRLENWVSAWQFCGCSSTIIEGTAASLSTQRVWLLSSCHWSALWGKEMRLLQFQLYRVWLHFRTYIHISDSYFIHKEQNIPLENIPNRLYKNSLKKDVIILSSIWFDKSAFLLFSLLLSPFSLHPTSLLPTLSSSLLYFLSLLRRWGLS